MLSLVGLGLRNCMFGLTRNPHKTRDISTGINRRRRAATDEEEVRPQAATWRIGFERLFSLFFVLIGD